MTSNVAPPGYYHQKIIQNVVLSRKLNAYESTALCLFDSPDGITYILPPTEVGLVFSFFTTVSVLAPNVNKVITDKDTTLLVGNVEMIDVMSQYFPKVFSANGVTDIAVENNGTTTGGRMGCRYDLTAIATNKWVLEGRCITEGRATTPFKAS